MTAILRFMSCGLSAAKSQNQSVEDKDYRQQQRQQSASIVCSGFHFFLLF